MKRWKADLSPISENEKSRCKRLDPVSLGHVENQKNGTRDENSSAHQCSACVPKKNLNYKIKTSPENGQPHPFHPTQLPLPHRINALLASQMPRPKLSTLAYQKKRKNFLRQQLSMLHHAFVAPHPEPKPQRYTLNFTSLGLRLSSHTSLFWTLPEQLFMLHHAFVPTHPEPTTTYLPKMHHKTSGPKIFISHICFELCRYSSPCYTTHVSQPILNQRPKTHYKL